MACLGHAEDVLHLLAYDKSGLLGHSTFAGALGC